MDELSQGLVGMDPAEVALGAGMVGFVAALMLVFSMVWFFLSAVGYYKMFQKAGEAGWKAFIPYYRTYIQFRFAWDPKKFLVFLAAILLCEFLGSSESVLAGFIVIVAGITVIVMGIKLELRVAKSFGKTTIWGVLLFFFPFIVSVILGFGKAEYIGNTTKQKIAENEIVEI